MSDERMEPSPESAEMHAPRHTVEVAGLPIQLVEANFVESFCHQVTNHPHARDLHFINAYSVALASRDRTLFTTFAEADMLIPDGRPLALAAKARDRRARQFRGPEFFELAFDIGRQYGVRHYLLGSTEHTLGMLASRLQTKYPGIVISGTWSPPFRSLTREEREAQMKRIISTDPHVIWVGLGTPKQDFESQVLAKETGIAAVAVGAAFDFSAGTKAAAPPWIAAIGLEWLFRFASEPRRLWRRYLIGNVQFICAVTKGAIRDRPPGLKADSSKKRKIAIRSIAPHER